MCEEELTVKVLDICVNTRGGGKHYHLQRAETSGNGLTALDCEGILIGMLNEGIEPNVVSYTTTIGACAKEGMKNSSWH